MKDNKVYGIVTDKIINLLEKNIIPWIQDWDKPLPQNFTTKHYYTGFTLFYLYCMRLERGYNSSFWITKNQIDALKGALKPWQNEKTEIVVIYEEDATRIAPPLLRFYDIYNIEQTTGIEYEADTRKIEDKSVLLQKIDTFRMLKDFNHFTVNLTDIERDLVLELGEAILHAKAGISNKDSLEYDSSYIKYWLTELKNDEKLFVRASAKAQEIVDSIAEQPQTDPLTNL